MRCIAIIPARSGSKGLRDKNIRELCGKPLMAYTIEAAIRSGLFDTIHVSTDSDQYAKIARTHGAEVPFLRNKCNAGDTASSWDVVREVLQKYKEKDKEYDICVLLQPTSPLRDNTEIERAIKQFVISDADSLTSVSETEQPIQLCFQLGESLSMEAFANSKYRNCRRQELNKYYVENGAIYIVKCKNVIRDDFDFYEGKCVAYPMERTKSIDIDDIIDFFTAEAVMRYNEVTNI